ncbi:MAG: DNA recombination protein RmuC [Candidatus Omnitrophica bacterium]|nr:DNA recombination protein RmuC [Candidatus Omnitrophota bacterium]
MSWLKLFMRIPLYPKLFRKPAGRFLGGRYTGEKEWKGQLIYNTMIIMETIILVMLFFLLMLVGFLAWRLFSGDQGRGHIESVLNEKFIDFSERISNTMESTRKQVEDSKDFLSKNAIKTLEHINNMNTIVGNLVQQQEKAQELGKSLEYLLQAPKLRGNYGETILEEMLEQVLPAKGMWERQYTIDGGEKVDAVVKYKNVVVPIDSKFPRDDYQKYLSSTDEREQRKHWSNYEKALKVQINSIRDKYIKPEKGTTEFALLFIPSEAIYYETIAEKNFIGEPCQIYDYARDNKVIPVSPNTFFAFLQVIILGVRNVEIAKEAMKLQEILSKIEKDYTYFYSNFENIGKALDKAAKSYNTGKTHVQRFKKNLDSALRFEITSKDSAEHQMLSDEHHRT